MVALGEYEAGDESQLGLREGDVICVLEKGTGVWAGEGASVRRGVGQMCLKEKDGAIEACPWRRHGVCLGVT